MSATPTILKSQNLARRAAAALREAACPNCGSALTGCVRPTLLKRGAVTLSYDPYEVRWRGRIVPLSPTEAHLFSVLLRRGRASYETLDAALAEVGAKPATRSLVLLHIKRKFERIGAESPFEKIGPGAVRFRTQADENASVSTVIGLAEPAGLVIFSRVDTSSGAAKSPLLPDGHSKRVSSAA